MIRFQTATISEADSLAQFVNSAYRGEFAKTGWTTEADLLDGQRTDGESIKQIIEAPLNQIECAYSLKPESLIGCVHLIQEGSETLYFGMLTVSPTMQGKGFGKILLNHIEQIAKSYGCKKIRITVIPSRKELIDYYKRRGFKETGRFEAFPTDPKFGIPKVSDLSLQEFIKEL